MLLVYDSRIVNSAENALLVQLFMPPGSTLVAQYIRRSYHMHAYLANIVAHIFPHT